MIVALGSLNPAKAMAVFKAFSEAQLKYALSTVKVSSGIAEQPISLATVMHGARNRARGAMLVDTQATLGVGLESGLVWVPGVDDGYMDLCACAMTDGTDWFVGLSSAFEVPKAMVALISQQGLTMSEACVRVGMDTDPKIGEGLGVVGILTGGLVDREEQARQAVQMALGKYRNRELYR